MDLLNVIVDIGPMTLFNISLTRIVPIISLASVSERIRVPIIIAKEVVVEEIEAETIRVIGRRAKSENAVIKGAVVGAVIVHQNEVALRRRGVRGIHPDLLLQISSNSILMCLTLLAISYYYDISSLFPEQSH
ncbi:Protein CBG25971 [Caenorhabditis briggsae]|uniref:Protein CBG25971 n=1 Tax=Caenorhabditis briggsae TaxID=6238 RepID=B6IKS1_CAEBR|nr:Protein CBG25971 [Caenorhabditis briggsae]CAS00501.1 Protein CBG25971 [Caenorhabditis briggsae]